MKPQNRLESIDFLRGIAILLTFCAHHYIFKPINRTGWIGVQLFFVLSGFLISSLLFSEYKKFGNISPKLFLIRRGFKVYPMFYISVALTLIQQVFFPDAYVHLETKILLLNNNGIIMATIIEILFLQNIFFGFWGHHWSLSVEEIFYFSLVFLLYKLAKNGRLENRKYFFKITAFILMSCLLLRFIINLTNIPPILTYTLAPLRMDTLFAGVFVSYCYHFEQEEIKKFYWKYKKIILAIILPLLSFVPFTGVMESYFVDTIGYTFIYIALTCVLVIFLFDAQIVRGIQKIISPTLFKGVTKIGVYSYGIYLFHPYILRYMLGETYASDQYFRGLYTFPQVLLSFVVFSILSISIGVVMSKLIEFPILKLRDRFYPRRATIL
jgi:peptidoglycan/LPS O-acetylase OafA/YrhL